MRSRPGCTANRAQAFQREPAGCPTPSRPVQPRSPQDTPRSPQNRPAPAATAAAMPSPSCNAEPATAPGPGSAPPPGVRRETGSVQARSPAIRRWQPCPPPVRQAEPVQKRGHPEIPIHANLGSLAGVERVGVNQSARFNAKLLSCTVSFPVCASQVTFPSNQSGAWWSRLPSIYPCRAGPWAAPCTKPSVICQVCTLGCLCFAWSCWWHPSRRER